MTQLYNFFKHTIDYQQVFDDGGNGELRAGGGEASGRFVKSKALIFLLSDRFGLGIESMGCSFFHLFLVGRSDGRSVIISKRTESHTSMHLSVHLFNLFITSYSQVKSL